MSLKRRIFTSESVTEGHPDKVCDQIADAVLDDVLSQDPKAKVACEVCAHKNGIVVMGEITSNASIDIEKIELKDNDRLAKKILALNEYKDFCQNKDNGIPKEMVANYKLGKCDFEQMYKSRVREKTTTTYF